MPACVTILDVGMKKHFVASGRWWAAETGGGEGREGGRRGCSDDDLPPTSSKYGLLSCEILQGRSQSS